MNIKSLRTKELKSSTQKYIEWGCKVVGALFILAALALAGWVIAGEMLLRDNGIPPEAGFYAFFIFALAGALSITGVVYGLGFYFKAGRKAAWFTTAALTIAMLATRNIVSAAVLFSILVITTPGTWWVGIGIRAAGTSPQQPDPSTSVDSLDENA